MSSKACDKCGKTFRDSVKLRAHYARKTPCAPILGVEDLPDEKKDSPNRCKFCGRVFRHEFECDTPHAHSVQDRTARGE